MSLNVLVKAGDRVRFVDRWRLLSRNEETNYVAEVVSTNHRGGCIVKLSRVSFSPPMIYVATRFITQVDPAAKRAPIMNDNAGLRPMLGARHG